MRSNVVVGRRPVAPHLTVLKNALRKIEVCPLCNEYPCDRIPGLAKGYVTMLPDGKRMKEIGIERWIEEQEKRKATGFAYVDIRCEPYDIPD